MQLNLPILPMLQDKQNILIAGAGGGFDVFAGLPLYFTLREMGKTVHLANYTFMDLKLAELMSQPIHEIPDLLMGVHGKVRIPTHYFPEGHLADWFAQRGEDVPVWIFDRTGAVPLARAYQHLIDKFKIDALILVDGGVDSLMRGDEEAPGTLIEDSISLAATQDLDIPVKIQACVGFGTEIEEAVCHHHALENMAALAKAGAFYGACALTPQMSAFQLYESACRHAWEQTPDAHKSHISTRIIPAVRGEFGNFHMYPRAIQTPVFISPLMSLYWFFDANQVAASSYLVPALRETEDADEARNIGLRAYKAQTLRPIKRIPY
jgi:hypothetical protein